MSGDGGEGVTYRAVLREREFLAVLVSQGLSLLGDQVTRIAVALLVYQRTSSAFLASATFAVSYLTYLVGGPVLSAFADRYPRRTVMVASDLARALVVAVLALTEPPVPLTFALLVLLAALAPAFNSAQAATLPDVLPGEAYPRGNALLNVVYQGAQVLGFVIGGALLATVSAEQALLLDAATFLVSAGALLGTLRWRPAPGAPGERQGLWRETLEGVRVVRDDPVLRSLLGFALLGAATVAAPEALAVPVADAQGGGTVAAGLLIAALPAGFVVGSFAVLRLPAERRVAALPALVALSAVPLLLTPLSPSVPVTLALWLTSGLGSSLQLVASAAYVAAAPEHARGRAYGLATTALVGAQGVSQLVAGGLAGLSHGAGGAAWGVAGVALVVLGITVVPFRQPQVLAGPAR